MKKLLLVLLASYSSLIFAETKTFTNINKVESSTAACADARPRAFRRPRRERRGG